MRISEHMYVYFWNDPRENNCNTIFINGKVPTIIDPGHSHRLDDLFSRMMEDHLDPLLIKLVIITHAHPDHISGILKLQNHAKIAISVEEEKYIENIGRAVYESKKVDMPNYRIDFLIKEGNLVLGKHELEIISTPGHTPGEICVYWPRYKVLLSGDVIFDHAVGRTDLPGGDANALKSSIRKLETLPIELLIPGHGGAIQGMERVKKNFSTALSMLQ
jgi:hydroxyacylglutathione hydrolase